MSAHLTTKGTAWLTVAFTCLLDWHTEFEEDLDTTVADLVAVVDDLLRRMPDAIAHEKARPATAGARKSEKP